MNTCVSCGGENADGVRFCVRCGSALPTAPQPGSWQQPSGGLGSSPGGGFGGGAAGSASGGLNSSYGAGQPGYGQQASAPPYGAGAYSQPSGYEPPAPSYQPAALYNPQTYGPNAPGQAGAKADAGIRLVSWLIDGLGLFVCLIPIVLIAWIPILGWLAVLFGIPIIAVCYHLLRDIQAQSPGKYLIGLKVMSKSGGEATSQQRVMRNILFAIPPACMILPLIGHVIGMLLAFVIMLAETVTILSSGERLGDRIGNTVVVRTK